MQEIIQKIAGLYLRYGVKSLTMDDLAHELGVSKKTLYLHFRDKKDVVAKAVDYLIEKQREGIGQVMENPDGNAIDQLMQITLFFASLLNNASPSLTYDLQKYHPEVWEEVEAFKQNDIFSLIMGNIERGMGEGLYRHNLNKEIIASIYISRMEMYVADLWRPLDKYSLPEIFQELFAYHIRGIASEQGIQYMEQNMEQWAF